MKIAFITWLKPFTAHVSHGFLSWEPKFGGGIIEKLKKRDRKGKKRRISGNYNAYQKKNKK